MTTALTQRRSESELTNSACVCFSSDSTCQEAFCPGGVNSARRDEETDENMAVTIALSSDNEVAGKMKREHFARL